MPDRKKIIPYAVAVGVAAVLLAAAVIISGIPQKSGITETSASSDENTVVTSRAPAETEAATLPPVTEGTVIPPLDTGIPELTVSEDVSSDEFSRDGVLLISKFAVYPVFDGYDRVDLINAKIAETARSLTSISQYEKDLATDDLSFSESSGIDFEASTYNTSFSSKQKNGALSVLFETVLQGGGAAAAATHRSLCFDLRSGELISLDVFTGRSSDAVTSYVVSRFSVLIASDPGTFYDNASETVGASVSLYNFYITETGVAVFVRSGEISPAAFGDITIEIPFEEL